jgi:hypothetical protein
MNGRIISREGSVNIRQVVAAACIGGAVPAAAATQGATSTAVAVFHKKLFVSYQQASISGVPISYSQANPNGFGTTPVRSSGSGSAIGIGGSWVGRDHWLVQLAYDRASASFTDWRVRNRSIAFSSVDFTIGYATDGPVTFVPYFSFAPGWYSQSEFKKFDFGSESGAAGPGDWAYEAMEKLDYIIGLAVGMKVGFAKYFAVNGEMRWYKEDQGGGSGSCGTNCYLIDVTDRPPPEKYGSRTSLGMQVYFWK